jgi:predicted RNA-binding protein
MPAPRNYWMVVLSPENFKILQDNGFTLMGLERSLKKRAQRMEVGDRALFYVKYSRFFAATATVGAEAVEDATPMWDAGVATNEMFPWRVKLRPEHVLDETKYIDARDIAPRLEYVRKWTPERWPLAFQGTLHLIPKLDFQMLEDEMRKLSPRRSAPTTKPA